MASVLLRPKRPLPRRFSRRVSPAMRSFAQRRHQRHSGRHRERLKKMGRRFTNTAGAWWALFKRWYLYLAGVLVLCAIGVALFSPLLQVREIRVQRGEGRVDVARIQKALAPLFGRHLLLVSARDVAARAREVVPDLDGVSIQKEYPSRLFVRISLKPLIARLQLEEPKAAAVASGAQLRSGSGAMPASDAPQVKLYDYLTENGMYVSITSPMPRSKLPVMKIVDWGVRPLPDNLLLEPEFLARMQAAEKIMSEQFAQQITMRTVYLRAKEFHLSTAKFSMWFDMRGTLEEQVGRYRVFLKTVGLQNVRQYVDLRLEGRVVYR